MEIKICTLGGYDEVGRNMTAVKINDTAVLLDMGFYMQKIMDFEEEGGHAAKINWERMINIGIVPDVRRIDSWKSQVKAIALTHCHFDHIGAVPYLAPLYPHVPIYGTPFTMAVLQRLLEDDHHSLRNPLQSVRYNKRIRISDDVEMEFIYVTHSTLQPSFIVLHTPKGVIVYATDFKFDDHPGVGKKPDYEAIERIGEERVLALVVNSLYSKVEAKTPSERVARDMLEDTMLHTENQGSAIVGTCFASHIARLKSFADFGHKMGRQVVFLGRSMKRYVECAEEVGLVDFRGVDVVGYGGQIKKTLHKIEKDGADNYVVVCTGGQGEPHSVLGRMMRGELPFSFSPDDQVIFSNRVIPVEPNIANRQRLEAQFKKMGMRVYTDVHVSGHCSKEDLRYLIKTIHPEHIIPCHGMPQHLAPAQNLAQEMGYDVGKSFHLLANGEKLTIM